MNKEVSSYLGIIDRGVGGLGLYKAIREHSDRPILYFADSGYEPYGLVPKPKLNQRLWSIVNFLNQQGASQVAIACNAASAAFEDTENVKGIIPFGVTTLAKAKLPKMAMIAGQGTVRSNIYRRLLSKHNQEVRQRVAQPLSIHIEQGDIDSTELQDHARQILNPIKGYDAVLMACTHYPAIENMLSKHVDSDCRLLDPVDEMKNWIFEHWPDPGHKVSQRDVFFSSGNADTFRDSALKSFAIDASNIITLSQSQLDNPVQMNLES